MKYLCLALLLGCVTTEPDEAARPVESEWIAAVTSCPGWCKETLPPSAATTVMHGVWAASADDVFAVGDSGTILRRNNDAWTQMASNTTANLRGIYGTSSSDVWAGGPGGALVHFDGQSWSPVSGVTTDIDSVWVSSPTDAWFCGSTTVVHWTGSRFIATSLGGILLSVSGSGPNDVWVTGEMANARHWNGSTWTTISANVGTSSLMAVLAIANGDTWISNFMPNKETSHWNGTRFTAVKAGAIFNGMSALSTSDIWGAGGTKIAHWNGTAWALQDVSSLGANLTLWAVATRPGHAWAVGDNGMIAHHSF